MMFRSFVLLFLIPIGAYRLPCLSVDYFVSLSCKISANIKTLSLIDNNGNSVARCTLQGSSSNCLFKDFVKPVIGDKEVIFHLHRNLTSNVDRNWFCSQENNTFRPEILSSKADKTASTIVNLVGKIVQENNTQKILLTCSSCRIPNENHAEFLINYNSVDSLTYDDATGKCIHSYGECSRQECNCSTSGNEFSRFFVSKKELNTETYFSCDMRFHMKDEEQLIVFSKVSTLSFNGTDFTDRGTRTVIIKLTDINNRPKEEDSKTENILIPVIIASVIMVTILLTVAVHCNRKGRRLEKIKESEEDTPLLKDLETHDQYVQVNIGANNAETHEQYVQVNFDADNSLLNMISPESNSTRGRTSKKSYQESKDEMDCEDYVQAPDDITSKNIPDRIERDTKHINEKNEETDDEDYVQASDYLTLESIPDHIKTESKLNNDTLNKSISPQPTTDSQNWMTRLDGRNTLSELTAISNAIVEAR